MVNSTGKINTADYKTVTKDMIFEDFMTGWKEREECGKQGTTGADLLKLS